MCMYKDDDDKVFRRKKEVSTYHYKEWSSCHQHIDNQGRDFDNHHDIVELTRLRPQDIHSNRLELKREEKKKKENTSLNDALLLSIQRGKRNANFDQSVI